MQPFTLIFALKFYVFSLLQTDDFLSMIQNTGPYDLNIPVQCGATTTPTALVKRALSLGYRTIALNTHVSQSQFLTKKQAKQKTDDGQSLPDFPSPQSVKICPEDYPDLASKGLSPTILTRLTISITSNDFLLHYNKSAIAKQYDILAINIPSAACLLSLLKSGFRWDIATFSSDGDPTAGVKWSRKLYYECVEKNIYFELQYSPMIRDSTERRHVISQGHVYHSVGKSRNIVITSGARTPMELRAPGDVANLGFLLGLSENQGKDSVGVKCWSLVKSATGRRMGPFQVRIEKLDQAPSEENGESDGDESSEESGDNDSDMQTDD